jgi:hypothetical protein
LCCFGSVIAWTIFGASVSMYIRLHPICSAKRSPLRIAWASAVKTSITLSNASWFAYPNVKAAWGLRICPNSTWAWCLSGGGR